MPREVKKNKPETSIDNLKPSPWAERSNAENMIFYLAAVFKKLTNKEIETAAGVSWQTLLNYRNILKNDEKHQTNFFNASKRKSKIKEVTDFNKFYDYAAVINEVGLEEESLWERLSITGKQVFVWTKLREGNSIEDIAKLLQVGTPIIKLVSLKLNDLSDQDKEKFLPYLEAERTFDKNINLRIINVNWSSLKTEEEQFLHVLLRKYQGMTTTEIAQSWGISESEITKYLDIVEYISLEEIHNLLVKRISLEEIVKKVQYLKLELGQPIADYNASNVTNPIERGNDLGAEASTNIKLTISQQAKEFQQAINDSSTIKKTDGVKSQTLSVWLSEDSNIKKMIFYLLMREKGLNIQEIAKKIKLGSPTTIRNFRDVLRHYPEVQKLFFQQKIELSIAVNYSDEYHYACITNGLSLGKSTLWKNFSPEAKQEYIFQELNNHKTEEEIAQELGIKTRSITKFIKRYKDLVSGKIKVAGKTAKKMRILTEQEKQEYKNAKKVFEANYLQLNQHELVEAQIATGITLSEEEIIEYKKATQVLIKVEWDSLTHEEKFLHFLLRKHQNMSKRLIAVSLKISEVLVTEYFNIIQNIQENEIINILGKKIFTNQETLELANQSLEDSVLSMVSPEEIDSIASLIPEDLNSVNPSTSFQSPPAADYSTRKYEIPPPKKIRRESEQSSIQEKTTVSQEDLVSVEDLLQSSNTFLDYSLNPHEVKETNDTTRILTPQQAEILAGLKSTSLQPYNASTIEESKRSKIESEQPSIKEALTRLQEDLVPIAPKEFEPQEINRPKRALTPQQEAILAGLKPYKPPTSSQPPSEQPFSFSEYDATSIFDTVDGTLCFSSLQNNKFRSHPMDDSYRSEYESSAAQ